MMAAGLGLFVVFDWRECGSEKAMARNPRSLKWGKLVDVVGCFLNLVSANQPGLGETVQFGSSVPVLFGYKAWDMSRDHVNLLETASSPLLDYNALMFGHYP